MWTCIPTAPASWLQTAIRAGNRIRKIYSPRNASGRKLYTSNGIRPRLHIPQRDSDKEFFLPNANKVAHRQLKDSARKLVSKYITEYGADLHRVWQTEYPFELHLPGVTVSGRADVILDTGATGATSLTLIDYKHVLAASRNTTFSCRCMPVQVAEKV